MRRIPLRLGVLLLATAMLMIPTAFALWIYYDPMTPVSDDLSLSVGLFDYAPEQVIPGEEADDIGENHLRLIENVLYEASYGLNATKKPIIHEELAQDGDVVYGDQNVQGGNLKHLMIDSAAVDRLTFLIVRISATEYHTYTYVSADVSGGLPGQSRVHVYKTVMKKGDDGVWSAPASYEGYATVSAPGIVYRAIDYRTWTNHV